MTTDPSAYPPAARSSAVQILPVAARTDRHQFFKLVWPLYADDSNWVAPLLLERLEHISTRNPYFEHAHWQAWIAARDGKPVGRISAQIDQLHLDRYNDATGFFGMLEAEDDADVFNALTETAEDWLRAQGMRRVRGPFNLSINQEAGLLIEGFDTPPSIMMGHARPYYGQRIEEQGYVKAKDLLAYRIHPDFEVTPLMETLRKKAENKASLRPLNRSKLKDELEILRDIFNDAWSENWGFVPFTKAEFKEIGRALTMLVEDDFVQIAEVDGEPAAFIVCLPNINDAIRDLNGKLLPFGWLKLLWRLKVRYPTSARIPLMGVRKRFQQSRLGPALAFLVIDALRAPVIGKGIKDVEMSWILEDNSGMRNIIESIGGLAYKRYRVYEKVLC